MSPSAIIASLLVTLIILPAPTVDSASLRDYVNSAVHYVGLDSLVSVEEEVAVTTMLPEPEFADASAPLPRCCDLPQPPCGVEKKVVAAPVVVPVVPAPCPPVDKPLPPCAPCPIDYEHANAKSHSKMWEVAMKGKALASTLTHALASPVVFTNEKISAAASLLPGALAAKGRILGAILSAPVQFAAGKSSLIAKGVSGVVVGVPVAIGTGVAAGVSGLMEKMADIGRQEQACLCKQQQEQHRKEDGKKHEKVIPCPESCQPGLLASGSKNEEKFTIDEPVTDSAVTDAIGGNQGDSQESVTDSTFTTTDGSVVVTLTDDGQLMGMPDRMLDM